MMRSPTCSQLLSSSLLVSFALLPFSFAANDPTPFVAPVGTNFLGYDGSWSPVALRIGTPQQWMLFLPNTLSQETWVVGPSGCDGTSLCVGKRGGLFFANESSTFQPQGFYDIDSDSRIFNDQPGYYGFDAVALSDTISVDNQIVAVINSTDFWIGNMGLGVQQTRFNGSQDISPLLSSLVADIGAIPSHSYGYTAGASYRLKTVPASLTLGGVDANRFVPNNMSFTLATDYAPVVAINSITVSCSPSEDETLPSNWNANPQTLLDLPQSDYLFTIDSSTPFLWLPEKVCDEFANALNLTYNDSLQLYTFPNTSLSSPATLDAWNLTFTFGVSNLPRSSEQIELTLPYDAFNLKLSYPFPNLQADFTSPPTNYFPLRKAANSSQYIIGRAFLQETYLAVDYERNNFSLSQAVFTLDAVNNVNLVSITRPENSIFPGPPAARGLSTGAKAGIGVGAAVGAIVAFVLIWWFCFRRKPAKKSEDVEKEKKIKRPSFFGRTNRTPESEVSVSELLADKHHPAEAPADSSATRYELSGNNAVEMPAAPVSPSFYASISGATPLARNDPRRPAELEHRNSMTKGGEVVASERPGSPVPPYSPAELNNNRNSSTVSPYSGDHSGGFGTASSGEQGISPVALHAGHHSHQSGTSNERSPVSPSMSSPMTPELVARAQQHVSNGPETSPPFNPNGTLAVPQLNGRPLSRSPSTGSRFVEEGLTATSEERARTSPSPRHRFSWEQ